MKASEPDASSQPYFERVIAPVLGARKKIGILGAACGMIALIATADWAIGNRASLGILYILPMVVAAMALSPFEIGLLATVCSALRSRFDVPSPLLEAFLRFLFAFISYLGSGLFVIALNRQRAETIENLASIRREQELRREAEEQLKILVESSPAAILTLDGRGIVLAANTAANSLVMLPAGESLRGRAISGYLPVLADALQFNPGPTGLRTAAQCQGFRDNGEIFLANTWFSSWSTPEGRRLAAIIVDSSEEMRDREEENLHEFLESNQIAAAAMSHEVRNLCAAISVVSSNLKQKRQIGEDEDIQALASLVKGLEKIASVELRTHGDENRADVGLQAVLDDLRIVIEPQWREIGGRVRWRLPPVSMLRVIAERHGLLQTFLNLAQNSHRAVQECPVRELLIEVSLEQQKVIVRFGDSGPGVSVPERLFAPFQLGADGTGLGLYVSRAIVRSYGGDLRLEERENGSCFIVELEQVRDSI